MIMTAQTWAKLAPVALRGITSVPQTNDQQ